MDSRTDEELLPLARRFDPRALASIYDRYSNDLYRYAMRLLNDPEQAEDCVSEVYSRLLQAFRQGGGPNEHLKPYLYRSAHNWAIDHYRRQPVVPLDTEAELFDPNPGPSQQAEQNMDRQLLRSALKLLTPDQRQVILLRYVEGWDLEEVAASLQKPVGAVKSLQHRAIASLQRILIDQKEEII
jgi:RNA polymerase sigma-70 factor (ECF subfamily)